MGSVDMDMTVFRGTGPPTSPQQIRISLQGTAFAVALPLNGPLEQARNETKRFEHHSLSFGLTVLPQVLRTVGSLSSCDNTGIRA